MLSDLSRSVTRLHYKIYDTASSIVFPRRKIMIIIRGTAQTTVTTQPMMAPMMLNIGGGPEGTSETGIFEVMVIHDTTQNMPKPTT
jgi:hypothetical protein